VVLAVIDIAPLFGGSDVSKKKIDQQILAAATSLGFMMVTGLPDAQLLTPQSRDQLKEIFQLPNSQKRALLRKHFEPANASIYRGMFEPQPGVGSYKEGIDIGPDIARETTLDPNDPLTGLTPLPQDDVISGWRNQCSSYYTCMERTGNALMQSLARGLQLQENHFDNLFNNPISTLRILRYPLRSPETFGDKNPEEAEVKVDGEVFYISTLPHVDSGILTLLLQDGVPGLQVQDGDGLWQSIPLAEATLVVNFGRLLETLTSGRIKATPHRVVARNEERFSIAFFYEPSVDALIKPLPIDNSLKFEPFYYGDFVWEFATRFIEQRSIKHLRQPRGPIPERKFVEP